MAVTFTIDECNDLLFCVEVQLQRLRRSDPALAGEAVARYEGLRRTLQSRWQECLSEWYRAHFPVQEKNRTRGVRRRASRQRSRSIRQSIEAMDAHARVVWELREGGFFPCED